MRNCGILCAMLLVAACNATDGPAPLVTTSVLVTAAPTQIVVNGTAQASALVKDQNGNPLVGKTIEWSSLNPNFATVDAGGVIRGVAPGTATIQGKADGVIGTATIVVTAPPAGQACVGGLTLVNPATGALSVLSASATGGCVKVASTGATSEYIVIAANASPVPDQFGDFILKSDTGEVVPSTSLLASPGRILSALRSPPPSISDGSSLQLSFESRLRKLERRTLHISDGRRAMRLRNAETLTRYSASVVIPAVGEKTQIKVPVNAAFTSGGCGANDFTTVTATVQSISSRAIIYVDDAAPAGGFTASDFQVIGDEFDNLIYPTGVDYFGTPLDLDSNTRIVILYTPLVNRLTPPNTPGGFVGGFFFAGDLFPVAQCAQSNLAEIMYLLAPDPQGTINGNRRATLQVRQGTRGTIAHEFQHLINASERFRHPVTTEFEDVWLDEALSHFGEDATGRVLKGIGETANATFSQLATNIDDYNGYFFQNFARFQKYLQDPGAVGPTSEDANKSLAVRGAAWALLRYTADHHAPGEDVKAFTRSLVPGPLVGVPNLLSHAGNVLFDTLIAGWMAANYADDLGIPGLNQRYTYKTYDMRRNIAAITTPSGVYPLEVVSIEGTGFASGTTRSMSASGNYFRFSRAAGGPARTFRFLNGDASGAAVFPGATLYILRSQ